MTESFDDSVCHRVKIGLYRFDIHQPRRVECYNNAKAFGDGCSIQRRIEVTMFTHFLLRFQEIY